MKSRLPAIIAAALLVSALWSQQPAAPRPSVAPLSPQELGAIPLVPPHAGKSLKKVLFDGKTLAGWRGNLDWWSVSDGAIVGKAKHKVPTSFLFTEDNYSDFRLTLSSKMVTSENHAGVCFWGEIAMQNDNQWYTHGPLVVFPRPSMWDYNAAQGLRVYKTTTETVTTQHDWVEVEILAQGNRVRAAFNGVQVMEWREPDPNRIKAGPIGLQLHAFTEPQEVLYKNIVVESFPKEDRLISLKP